MKMNKKQSDENQFKKQSKVIIVKNKYVENCVYFNKVMTDKVSSTCCELGTLRNTIIRQL